MILFFMDLENLLDLLNLLSYIILSCYPLTLFKFFKIFLMVHLLKLFFFNCKIFHCQGHPFITASTDGFILFKYIIIIIIIIIIIVTRF